MKSKVTERPILFSGPMVRAILEGRKSQTRRVIKPQPLPSWDGVEFITDAKRGEGGPDVYIACVGDSVKCDYGPMFGQPGDRLWVRESFALECDCEGSTPPFSDGRPIKRTADPEDDERWTQPHYRATDPNPDLSCEHNRCEGAPCERPWKPSIHMPRWASRISLAVVKVRAERIQQISHEDAIAEGIDAWVESLPHDQRSGDVRQQRLSLKQLAYSYLWDHINAERGFAWDANPWVWVLDFQPLEAAAQISGLGPEQIMLEESAAQSKKEVL